MNGILKRLDSGSFMDPSECIGLSERKYRGGGVPACSLRA